MIHLIGFAGRAGCGKSFAAKTLARQAGFVLTRFADPLKDMLRCLGLGDAEVDGDLKETSSPLLCGKTPRWAMQSIGTEWGRTLIGPSLWTDAWARRADAVLARGGAVVVDDVRFQNEVDLVRARGGLVVWINRGAAVAVPAHVSEALQPEACDMRVTNTGDDRFEAAIAGALLEENAA